MIERRQLPTRTDSAVAPPRPVRRLPRLGPSAHRDARAGDLQPVRLGAMVKEPSIWPTLHGPDGRACSRSQAPSIGTYELRPR